MIILVESVRIWHKSYEGSRCVSTRVYVCEQRRWNDTVERFSSRVICWSVNVSVLFGSKGHWAKYRHNITPAEELRRQNPPDPLHRSKRITKLLFLENCF